MRLWSRVLLRLLRVLYSAPRVGSWLAVGSKAVQRQSWALFWAPVSRGRQLIAPALRYMSDARVSVDVVEVFTLFMAGL
eukprot:9741789-Ditylum_brightwellii.AAC.1